MAVFGETYANYYNLLYKDKDYNSEANYIYELINENSNLKNSLLDIGCGTGKHLKYFKDKNFDVAGVDMSKEMLCKAKSMLCEISLQTASSKDFYFDKKFDVITSLFHVVSYLTSNDDIEKTFANISSHLNKGGIFIFDFWYGPACLSDPPTVRIKRLENENTKLTRIAEPVMHPNTNIVDVNFEIHLKDKNTNEYSTMKEVHNMRYFFLPELAYFLHNCGSMNIVKAYRWLTKEELSFDSWYGVIVAKKD